MVHQQSLEDDMKEIKAQMGLLALRTDKERDQFLQDLERGGSSARPAGADAAYGDTDTDVLPNNSLTHCERVYLVRDGWVWFAGWLGMTYHGQFIGARAHDDLPVGVNVRFEFNPSYVFQLEKPESTATLSLPLHNRELEEFTEAADEGVGRWSGMTPQELQGHRVRRWAPGHPSHGDIIKPRKKKQAMDGHDMEDAPIFTPELLELVQAALPMRDFYSSMLVCKAWHLNVTTSSRFLREQRQGLAPTEHFIVETLVAMEGKPAPNAHAQRPALMWFPRMPMAFVPRAMEVELLPHPPPPPPPTPPFACAHHLEHGRPTRREAARPESLPPWQELDSVNPSIDIGLTYYNNRLGNVAGEGMGVGRPRRRGSYKGLHSSSTDSDGTVGMCPEDVVQEDFHYSDDDSEELEDDDTHVDAVLIRDEKTAEDDTSQSKDCESPDAAKRKAHEDNKNLVQQEVAHHKKPRTKAKEGGEKFKAAKLLKGGAECSTARDTDEVGTGSEEDPDSLDFMEGEEEYGRGRQSAWFNLDTWMPNEECKMVVQADGLVCYQEVDSARWAQLWVNDPVLNRWVEIPRYQDAHLAGAGDNDRRFHVIALEVDPGGKRCHFKITALARKVQEGKYSTTVFDSRSGLWEDVAMARDLPYRGCERYGRAAILDGFMYLLEQRRQHVRDVTTCKLHVRVRCQLLYQCDVRAPQYGLLRLDMSQTGAGWVDLWEEGSPGRRSAQAGLHYTCPDLLVDHRRRLLVLGFRHLVLEDRGAPAGHTTPVVWEVARDKDSRFELREVAGMETRALVGRWGQDAAPPLVMPTAWFCLDGTVYMTVEGARQLLALEFNDESAAVNSMFYWMPRSPLMMAQRKDHQRSWMQYAAIPICPRTDGFLPSPAPTWREPQPAAGAE